jgi:hypothetical protein
MNMRKIAILGIIGITLGISLPYGIKGQWWGFIGCLLAGSLWLIQSPYRAHQRANLILFVLAGFAAFGLIFDHSQLWTLTNIIFLLVVWDLDHYTWRVYEFEKDRTNQKMAKLLFTAHLKRLGIVAGLGWCFGLLALNIRFQITFTIALVLILLMVFGLRQVARYVVNL